MHVFVRKTLLDECARNATLVPLGMGKMMKMVVLIVTAVIMGVRVTNVMFTLGSVHVNREQSEERVMAVMLAFIRQGFLVIVCHVTVLVMILDVSLLVQCLALHVDHVVTLSWKENVSKTVLQITGRQLMLFVDDVTTNVLTPVSIQVFRCYYFSCTNEPCTERGRERE